MRGTCHHLRERRFDYQELTESEMAGSQIMRGTCHIQYETTIENQAVTFQPMVGYPR